MLLLTDMDFLDTPINTFYLPKKYLGLPFPRSVKSVYFAAAPLVSAITITITITIVIIIISIIVITISKISVDLVCPQLKYIHI